MKNVAQDKLNLMVEKIITKIENGETGLWSKNWISCGLPQNFATKTRYNGFNILALLIEGEERGFKTNYWLTFNQLKALKGTLKKGSTATPIFFFNLLEKKEMKEGVEVIKTIPILKFYNVFNIEQTDLEIGNVNATIKPDFQEFVQSTGITIKQAKNAFYSPSDDYVGMPDVSLFTNEESYMSTLLHEMSHATGHSSRLDRDLTGTFGTESYGKEELIAELGSVFLGSIFEIKTEMRHAEYLESWIKVIKAEPKILWQSASAAQKILDYFLDIQNKEDVAA